MRLKNTMEKSGSAKGIGSGNMEKGKEYILIRKVFDWKSFLLCFLGAAAFVGLTFIGYMTGHHFISGICSAVSLGLFLLTGVSAGEGIAKKETIRLEEVKI